MKQDNISICITLKNRAKLLDQFLHHLQFQNYDTKLLEICITDGFSTDNLKEVLENKKDMFYQIKYATSDRSVLPFEIISNNPACDYNSQMVNQPTFEKIIRTDAEMLFTHPDQLNFINQTLNDKDVAINHFGYIFDTNPNQFKYEYTPTLNPNFKRGYKYRGTSAFCICINKSTFIENGGFDERFAIGFAGEDSYMLEWYKRNKKLVHSPHWVVHQYHGPRPDKNPEFIKLRDSYTLPLMVSMRSRNEMCNVNNPDWKRPEMLSNHMTFGNKIEKGIDKKMNLNMKEFTKTASTCNSVLEIGCGEQHFLRAVKSPIKIGIDAFRPILEKYRHPDILTMTYDLNKGLSQLFLDDAIECVAGIDIVEHFDKEAAIKLIKECEKVATKYVMFFIPVGNHPQTKDDRNLGNDHYQTHRSTWYPKDMEDLGYIVDFKEKYHKDPNKDSGAMFCLKKIGESNET